MRLHSADDVYLYPVCIARSGVSKYLVQWDKEDNFERSQAGGDVSHADAAEWSSVVVDTQYQVGACAASHNFVRAATARKDILNGIRCIAAQ